MDFTRFLEETRNVLHSRVRGHGYARFPDQPVSDLYGTSAAVGILIALGETPAGPDADRLAEAVLSFQQADGTFIDESHGANHRAATALTTLDVLRHTVDAPPAVDALLHPEAVAGFLDELDWDNPWPASHEAAGVLAIGLVAKAPDRLERERWLASYLEWLDAHADPRTGLWLTQRMGALHEDPGLFGNLGCSFHLHFLYARLGRPWPHPSGVVDTGLALYHDSDAVIGPDTDWGFRQLDWAYSVGRAARGGHRRDDVDAALSDLADRAAKVLNAPGAVTDDLHVLQARVGLVAELAQHLTQSVETGGRTLTSIVDVRPFI